MWLILLQQVDEAPNTRVKQPLQLPPHILLAATARVEARQEDLGDNPV
jgi:hypothetical protein